VDLARQCSLARGWQQTVGGWLGMVISSAGPVGAVMQKQLHKAPNCIFF